MRLPHSIQAHMSLALGSGVAVLWLAAALLTAATVRDEMNEVFDSALEETAQRILPLAVIDILGREEDGIEQRVSTVRTHEELFTYVVRDDLGRVLMRSHSADDATFPPFDGMGFSQTATHRIYQDAAVRGTVTITVAEPLSHRAEAARETIMALALPLALLVPLSLLGVWWLVRRMVRPVAQFGETLATRGRDDLAPVPDTLLPIELKPMADAVNALLTRLRRTLEAERSFTANSAHELRTPVAAALAQIQRLIAELGGVPGAAPATNPATVVARAREVEGALRRLARLSEKLLQLARADGGRMRAPAPADISPVLGMVVVDLRRGEAGRHITLTLPTAGVLSDIDPDAFAILARNLIENALRHSGTDGEVAVTLSQDRTLCVQNDGPVVPPERLALLTDRFQRGATLSGGTGLGLAIVEAIAKGTGGRNVSTTLRQCCLGFKLVRLPFGLVD